MRSRRRCGPPIRRAECHARYSCQHRRPCRRRRPDPCPRGGLPHLQRCPRTAVGSPHGRRGKQGRDPSSLQGGRRAFQRPRPLHLLRQRGRQVCRPSEPGPRRASMRELQDEASKPIGERLYHAAIEAEYNELVYMWPLPGEEEPTQKSLVTKVEANTRRAVVEPSPSRGRSATVRPGRARGCGSDGSFDQRSTIAEPISAPKHRSEDSKALLPARRISSGRSLLNSQRREWRRGPAVVRHRLGADLRLRALVRGVHGGTISCRIFGHGDRGRDHCRRPVRMRSRQPDPGAQPMYGHAPRGARPSTAPGAGAEPGGSRPDRPAVRARRRPRLRLLGNRGRHNHPAGGRTGAGVLPARRHARGGHRVRERPARRACFHNQRPG